MRRNEQGFTIVELLLSVLVFAIVSAAVYRVFSTAVEVSGRVDRSLKANLMTLSAIHALENDLNNIVGHQLDPIKGNAEGLSMIVGRKNGLVAVRYRINEDGALVRSQAAVTTQDFKDQIILSGSKNAYFSFGYLDADGKSVVWKGTWHRNVPPFAVRLNAASCERTIYIPHGEWGHLT